MSDQAEECPHCGAKMVRYKQTMNACLLRGLMALASAGRSAIADLDLGYTDRCNFQKLRYWGLIEHERGADGRELSGRWQMTNLGYAFLSRSLRVPRHMWTYRGEPTAPDGDRVGPEDLDEAFTYRLEWAEAARAIRLEPGYGEQTVML